MRRLSGLSVERLTLRRGARDLFQDLGFHVGAGVALAIEGPNGTGKTSLLRAIAGFLDPYEGSIRLQTETGKTLTEAEERAHCVGWLGHQDGAKPQLTALETLGFYARFYGASASPEGALDRVGLRHARDLPVQFLSAGQKRRLALARLSMVDRPLWLLDEPMASLDRRGKILVTELISSHCGNGGLVLAATHESLGVSAERLTLGREP